MWLRLQQDKPEDFAISTGVTTPVRDFIRMAFREVGVELDFKGEGVDETATVISSSNKDFSFEIGQIVVKIYPDYFRPTEVEILIGDNTKAKTKLGWKPKYTLAILVQEMMEADLTIFKKEKYLKDYKG
jgi:GDPmannose 4,6-dehydratase